MSHKMRCSRCGHENPVSSKFCMECGSRVGLRCAQCRAELPPTAKFCNECGTSVELSDAQPPTPHPASYTPRHLAEKILDSAAALEGERKTITALFADIKGSMELLVDLDPEEARRVIDPVLGLMMDAVHRYEGYVAQSMGDGIFALFGAPIAHEDHPQRACYAALRLQEAVRAYTNDLRRERGITLQVRVGLNTGEVVVRSIHKDDLHTDYVPVGHSTSLAARMENLATPGSIIASAHTRKLAEGYFQFKSLGPAKVKGVSEPVEIFEVLGPGPLRTRLQLAVRRGLVRFVGRHAELDQMRRAWKSSQASQGQIVAVMGEAGVGKSRLVYEFKVPLESECLVLEAFSVSHGKAHAYLPLIDILKSYFQISLHDDERQRREKIGGRVLMLDRALEDTLPYLFVLLGIQEPESSLAQMSPQIRRQRTLDAIKRLLLRESLNQPLLLIFEDLHWIDDETQAFLDLIAESIASARILLLVNYRPEYQASWGSKTYYTRLRLDPLGKEEAEELLTALLGEVEQPEVESLKQLVLEKTEGNPFFMEEVVQTLAEQGILAGERGRYRLEASPAELEIPTTVQGVLAARIDRLSADEKEFLQTLAVIGKEFPFGLLEKVIAEPEDELHRLVSQLQASEFIYEQPAFPEPEYIFKHALTQEVAYQSVLLERRKRLHERTAQAIEELYRYALDAHYNDLAHHYSRTDNIPKAVEYLRLAAEQAAERSAYGEAIDHVAKGLELLENHPATPERDHQELLLQIALGGDLMVTRGVGEPEVEKAFGRARELCQQLGEIPELFGVLSALRMFYLVRAQQQTVRELGGQLLSLAQDAQVPGLLSLAHNSLGQTMYWFAEFGPAREHLERALAVFEPEEDDPLTGHYGIDNVVSACGHLAWVLRQLGYPEQALERSRQAIRRAEQLSHAFTTCLALSYDGSLRRILHDPQAVQERAAKVIELATEHGFADSSAHGAMLRAWTLVQQGQADQGIAQMCGVVDLVRGSGMELGYIAFLTMLAEAYAVTGRAVEGLPVVDEGLNQVEKTGLRSHESYLHRFKGELLLARSGDHQAEAEVHFGRAIDIAQRQSAKSLELEAAISLSRLWQRQAKKGQARELLGGIYGWFTEGFDTHHLREAKALLDQLC